GGGRDAEADLLGLERRRRLEGRERRPPDVPAGAGALQAVRDPRAERRGRQGRRRRTVPALFAGPAARAGPRPVPRRRLSARARRPGFALSPEISKEAIPLATPFQLRAL